MDNGYFFNHDYLSRIPADDVSETVPTPTPTICSYFLGAPKTQSPVIASDNAWSSQAAPSSSSYQVLGASSAPSPPDRTLDPNVPSSKPPPTLLDKLQPFAAPAGIILLIIIFK